MVGDKISINDININIHQSIYFTSLPRYNRIHKPIALLTVKPRAIRNNFLGAFLARVVKPPTLYVDAHHRSECHTHSLLKCINKRLKIT